uniref:Cysteine-rich secretory protein LCCL domain containing 2 n=1 Tax=Nothobranchius korthausae TaxID=1143690 RepID=A0A1A8F495_9TELE
MNEVEKPQVPLSPRTTSKPVPKLPKKPASKPSTPKPASPRTTSPKSQSNPYLAHNIKCETKLRDKCKGATCNRHKCPAFCLHKKGQVWGTGTYDAQSSICRAAIHAGVIGNGGGLVDVTRTDKSPFFVRSTKNGVESLRRKSYTGVLKNGVQSESKRNTEGGSFRLFAVKM